MTLTLFLLAVLASVLGRVIGEDAKTLIPRFSRFLLRQAASRINGNFGAGFYEEWLSHLEETPELTLKLWHALSVYVWGSGLICREIGYSEESLRRYDKVKRAIDLVFVVLISPTALLYVAIMAFAVRFTGSAPFHSAVFAGQYGQPIRVWKITTLKPTECWKTGDERQIQGVSAHYEFNRFGRFLRRTSLDRLPILWSVVRGDMSMIGPRLVRPAFGDLENASPYPSTKPGITGWSQVNMRTGDETDFEKLDQVYSERRSLLFDLKIIWLSLVNLFSSR